MNVGFTPNEIWFSSNFAWELKGGVFARYSSPYVELQKKKKVVYDFEKGSHSLNLFPTYILICT